MSRLATGVCCLVCWYLACTPLTPPRDAGPASSCGPATCSDGCCDEAGTCVPAGDQSSQACGAQGAACAACAPGTACLASACVPVVEPEPSPTPAPDACQRDLDCRERAPGSVCREGRCVPEGRACDLLEECVSTVEGDACNKEDSIGCFCDTHDAPPGSGRRGTCRQRLGQCEECRTDAECGGDRPEFWGTESRGPGICAGLPGDMGGKKYCRLRPARCACGNVPDSRGFCYPQDLVCGAEQGCFNDSQCSASTVCTVNQTDLPDGGACGGLCVPRCRWDARLQTEAPTDVCKARGMSCWVDARSLDPNSPSFGSGRCRLPCRSDQECGQPLNPFGDASLQCRAEPLEGGGDSLKRCRPGGCLSDEECTEAPAGAVERGYCDRDTRTCQYASCRLGVDPVTRQPFDDCLAGHVCEQAAGSDRGRCRQVRCTEGGGATLACSTGELCCGQDKNQDGVSDRCPPTAELNPASQCYAAPRPWACTTCRTDADCNGALPPSWHECTARSNAPSCSTLPARCVFAPAVLPSRMPNRPTGDPLLRVCAPATVNDERFNPDPLKSNPSRLGCPSGFTPSWQYADVNPGGGDDLCTSDADCSVGTADGGRCGRDPRLTNRDGGATHVCRCGLGTGKAMCPNAAAGVLVRGQRTGLSSECRLSTSPVPGVDDSCIRTVVCLPPQGQVFKDAGFPDFGCGFRCDTPGAGCPMGSLCNPNTGKCQLN